MGYYLLYVAAVPGKALFKIRWTLYNGMYLVCIGKQGFNFNIWQITLTFSALTRTQDTDKPLKSLESNSETVNA